MTALATHRRVAPNDIKTGDRETDDLLGSLFMSLLEKGAQQGAFFSIPRALAEASKHAESRFGGIGTSSFEGKVSAAMGESRGFKIPWQARLPQIESRGLDTGTGAGSIASIIPDRYMIDVLRSKLVCKKLGAQVTNLTGVGSQGTVQLPQKSASSSVFWVGEGVAPASSNMSVGAVYLKPLTVAAFTDVTRKMIDGGQPGFTAMVIEDLMSAIAVETDRVALNGLGTPNNQLGLFQLGGGVPVFTPANAGVITYVDLVKMKMTVGQANAESPADKSMGWLTSSAGRAKLELLDLGGTTTTGRFAWKSTQQVIDNELVTCESILGWPAEATESVPSGYTGPSLTNATAIAVGNFSDMIINFWGDGVDILIDWTKFSSNGVLRITAFFDVAMVIRRPKSFTTYSSWTAT
jgi:HK97 family phage major capsid protein